MDLAKTFATDASAEQEGRWFPLAQDARVKIARTNNPRYRELLRAKTKPIQQSLARGLITDDAVLDPILVEVMAKTIVLDWEGFTDDGDEVKYSVENAVKYLTKFKDFRDWCVKIADDMQSFKEESTAVGRSKLPVESSGS